MGRFKLGYRRITSTGRNLPKDLMAKIKANLEKLQNKVSKYDLKAIIGFDESSSMSMRDRTEESVLCCEKNSVQEIKKAPKL